MSEAPQTAETIILMESPEAAEQVTVTAWKSRNGYVSLSEQDARYDGATHFHCPVCGTPRHRRSSSVCHPCKEKQKLEQYSKAKVDDWDGLAMLYSDTLERFFNDPDEVIEEAEHSNKSLADLRVFICLPRYADDAPIDADHWYDELPDDHEVPDGLQSLIDEFNAKLKGLPVLSWMPGPCAWSGNTTPKVDQIEAVATSPSIDGGEHGSND